MPFVEHFVSVAQQGWGYGGPQTWWGFYAIAVWCFGLIPAFTIVLCALDGEPLPYSYERAYGGANQITSDSAQVLASMLLVLFWPLALLYLLRFVPTAAVFFYEFLQEAFADIRQITLPRKIRIPKATIVNKK